MTVPLMSKISPLIIMSVLSEAMFCLVDEVHSVVAVQIRVSGDSQQRGSHEERDALRDGIECLLMVWEMPGIFLQEIVDERFGGVFVSCASHEEMLEFAGDSSDIEDAVGPFDPFQVECDDVHSVSEEEV